RHFSYYAQLRASLAILASTGIGVFNEFNCAVDQSGRVLKIDDSSRPRALGTHAMAWLALEEWARAPSSGTIISHAFSIRKVSFDDCLRAMWPGASGRVAAYDLILSWGVDLQRAFNDRGARNVSSYVAQALTPIPSTVDVTLDFLVDFWSDF